MKFLTGENSFTGDLTSEDFVTGDVTITAITGDTVTAAIYDNGQTCRQPVQV